MPPFGQIPDILDSSPGRGDSALGAPVHDGLLPRKHCRRAGLRIYTSILSLVHHREVRSPLGTGRAMGTRPVVSLGTTGRWSQPNALRAAVLRDPACSSGVSNARLSWSHRGGRYSPGAGSITKTRSRVTQAGTVRLCSCASSRMGKGSAPWSNWRQTGSPGPSSQPQGQAWMWHEFNRYQKVPGKRQVIPGRTAR